MCVAFGVHGKSSRQTGDARSGVIIVSQVGFLHVILTLVFFSLDRLMGSTERVLSAFSFFLSLFD